MISDPKKQICWVKLCLDRRPQQCVANAQLLCELSLPTCPGGGRHADPGPCPQEDYALVRVTGKSEGKYDGRVTGT